MALSLDEQKTKDLFKQAVIELLEERNELFYELIAEAVEDTLLTMAIREGEGSETNSREEIIHILDMK